MINNYVVRLFGDCARQIRDTVDPSEVPDAQYIGLEHINSGTLTLNGWGKANDTTSIKNRFRAGDVLFGKLRPYFRKVIIAPFDGVCSTDIWVVRATNDVDQTYLYYMMASQEFVDEASMASEGTRMPRAKWDYLAKKKKKLPPLHQQKAIAHILGTLDEKIELNRKMNEGLEQIARAIFKSWFVDFDPVRAKAEGRQPFGMDSETAALFPDSFGLPAEASAKAGDSELREIPRGWKVRPIPEIIDFLEGPGIRNWQYTNSNEGTRFINIRCIQNNDLVLDSANRVKDEEAYGKYKHFLLQEGDIVVSISGTLGRSAIVRPEHLPLMLNTSVIRMRPKDEKCTRAFLFGYVASDNFLFELETRASGSVQRNFGPMHLKQIKILIPPKEILEKHNEVSSSVIDLFLHNLSQNKTLSDIRDELLPKLMSGKIAVPVHTM